MKPKKQTFDQMFFNRFFCKRLRIKKHNDTCIIGTVFSIDDKTVTMRNCEIQLGKRIEPANQQVIYFFQIETVQKECWKKVRDIPCNSPRRKT